ncbi:hypothetical protein ACFPPF_08530 [Xenophilus aerolatus]|jgi:hypothetical protein|nr:hypothetical protein [Xenophilus aerolatus]
MRSLLLISSALLSLGILLSVGPLGLMVSFALCLLTLVVSIQGPSLAHQERPLRPAVGAETLY